MFQFPSQSIIWLKNILVREALSSPLPSDAEESSKSISLYGFIPFDISVAYDLIVYRQNQWP